MSAAGSLASGLGAGVTQGASLEAAIAISTSSGGGVGAAAAATGGLGSLCQAQPCGVPNLASSFGAPPAGGCAAGPMPGGGHCHGGKKAKKMRRLMKKIRKMMQKLQSLGGGGCGCAGLPQGGPQALAAPGMAFAGAGVPRLI